jgi:hypothetical protein
MTYTEINGIKYELRARVGDVNRLMAKFKKEIDSVWKKAKNPGENINDELTGRFILEMVWLFIQPFWIFKPFLTFDRFSKMIELKDLNDAGQKCFLLLHGIDPEKFMPEDREPGNAKRPSTNGSERSTST